MATANFLWAAPWINGELLKLGISERTVSRHLLDRLTTPSQTWRTFLPNHIGSLAFTSTVTPTYALGEARVRRRDRLGGVVREYVSAA
jgi:hypothetical protein